VYEYGMRDKSGHINKSARRGAVMLCCNDHV
jgi:hypothetical protein